MNRFKVSNPKSRNPYICDDCGCAIPKGDKYFRSDGLYHGKPISFKECVHCHKLRRKMNALLPGREEIEIGDASKTEEFFDWYGYGDKLRQLLK